MRKRESHGGEEREKGETGGEWNGGFCNETGSAGARKATRIRVSMMGGVTEKQRQKREKGGRSQTFKGCRAEQQEDARLCEPVRTQEKETRGVGEKGRKVRNFPEKAADDHLPRPKARPKCGCPGGAHEIQTESW